jgi:rare lipoprotein A
MQRPDAQPRVEPLRAGGPNKPYEMLGQRYVPVVADLPLQESGLASWYGRKFHGLPTANGETYDMYAMTAAHRTWPIPSYVRVRNPANGREVVVRINDRGPFAPAGSAAAAAATRVIDLSYTAALKLGVLGGVSPVELRRLTNAEIRGGDLAAATAPTTPPVPDDLAPTETAAPAAGGYWLQLGAFRSRDAALQLQQRALREVADLAAVAVFEEAGWFRVQAGPWGERRQAQKAAAALQRDLGLAGRVIEKTAPP